MEKKIEKEARYIVRLVKAFETEEDAIARMVRYLKSK